MIVARDVSPDQRLTFIAQQIDDDVQLGFEGLPWHTHGDILAQLTGLPVQAAADRFVEQLLNDQLVIALLHLDGALVDAWISEDPGKDALYAQSEEVLEFRYWSGSRLQP